MNAPTPEDNIMVLRRKLAAKRGELLDMSPENARQELLNHPQPAALVHAFPEEDLHILIHEIGPDDALPLLALASHRQLEYLLDQELWQRDRLDFDAAGKWMERFLRADDASKRLLRWLADQQADLVEIFLGRAIEVRMREHDEDPSDFGPGYFTYDNVFFIRIVAPLQSGEQEAASSETPLKETVKRLLDQLAANDYLRFQAILLEAVHLLPAESEEEAYRLRTTRLAEKGFLPFEEAVGLYQPLSERAFSHKARRQTPLTPRQPEYFPLVPAALLPEDNLFTRALAAIDAPEHRQTLQEEFAALCNRIIVADRQRIHRRGDLAAIVDKASGYVSIGLEKRVPEGVSATRQAAAGAEALRGYRLEGLFRLGYHGVVQLKQVAERWVRSSWFAACGLPLTFWGERWLGVIGGLLIKRPLFFHNGPSGNLYREFVRGADIAWTRSQLDQVQTFDTLLSRLDLDRAALPRGRFLTYQNLLLTLWARYCLSLPEVVAPIPVSVFKTFFATLFPAANGPDQGPQRSIDASRKENFLQWLAERTREPADHLAAVVGGPLETMFATLEDHYGRVRPEHIDPRYVAQFLLETTHPHPR